MIVDLKNINESGKMYGGRAGDKLGIVLNDENWFLKFPKSMKGMRSVDMNYTTSQLSEYIGSNIYEILGFDTHKTMLGVYDDNLVVVCKDFVTPDKRLFEYREIQNYYNKELRRVLDETFSSSDTDRHGTNLETVMIHLKHNPVLKNIPFANKRFWQCVVVDGLINNNDRNSGNWGILLDLNTGKYSLAPIYDNGGSFSNKLSDRQMSNILKDDDRFNSSSLNIMSGYYYNDEDLTFKDIITDLNIDDLKDAIESVVPLIDEKMDDIISFINAIPSEYNGIEVMSDIRKEFYIKGMENRLEHILLPAYDLLMDNENEKGREL